MQQLIAIHPMKWHSLNFLGRNSCIDPILNQVLKGLILRGWDSSLMFYISSSSHWCFFCARYIATYFVLAVEGVPSGHHGNGKIHAWCFIAGGYIRLSVPYFREWKIGLAGGISFPNSLHSHHSDFAEANPSDTDSRYHSPSPKIEYYGLSMSFVFFSALMCGVCRPRPCPQVLLRIFHFWGCESAALTPPRKGANGGRAVPSWSRNGVYPMYPFYMCPAKCFAEIRDVAADSGCCWSFQKVSSPSDSKNDLPVHPDVSESSDTSTIPNHSSGSLMNPCNFGDGKDILQRSVVISDSVHSGLDVQNSDHLRWWQLELEEGSKPIQKLTAIQKLRFRNYDSETISTDSETIAIRKPTRFSNYDSETIAIQKLPRFRNYRDSETIAIQKPTRFRNYDSEANAIQKYRDSETNALQKLRFRNQRDSETAIQKLIRLRNSRKVTRFRNYRDSETNALQKLRFRN